jgi:NAD(P)-dependent dehydrogenase (short-subunit alcohol dehydrogenase family)
VDTGLRGRTAVITGGTRGIGFATAERFMHEGARVIVMARSAQEVAAAAERLNDLELDGKAHGVVVDVTDGAEIDRALAETMDIAGYDGVHVLVNNAGPILQGAPILGSTDDKWLTTHNTKSMGMLRMARKLAPCLPTDGTGRVVNVSGVSGRSLLPNSSASGMANAAIAAMTSYLAQELAERRINVNGVSPGLIRTEAWEANAARLGEPDGLTGEEFMHEFQRRLQVRLGRWADPSEVADVIVFLASDRASYITGQIIAVDGGLANFVAS